MTRAPAPTEPAWGVREVLVGWLVAYSVALVGGQLVLALAGVGPGETASLAVVVLAAVPLWAAHLTLSIGLPARRGGGVVADLGLRQRWPDVPVGLLVGVATQVVAVPAVYWLIFQVVGEFEADESARALTDRADSALEVGLLVLLVVVMAPLTEELVYRGLLLGALTWRYGPVVGLLGSSAFFGLIHLQPEAFAGQLVFGLVAAALVLATGRLGPAIWAHVGFNGAALVVLLGS